MCWRRLVRCRARVLLVPQISARDMLFTWSPRYISNIQPGRVARVAFIGKRKVVGLLEFVN